MCARVSCYPSVVGALWPTMMGILTRTFIRDCWKHRTAWAESCRLCDLQTTEVQVQTVEESKTKVSYVLPNRKREGEALFSPKSPHTTLGSRIQHQNFRGLQGFIYTYWSHMTLAGSRKNWIIKGGQLRENWAQSLKLSLVWWHRSIIPRP